MRRHLIALFVAVSILAIPALSFGLPRPPTTEEARETEVTEPGKPIRILAEDPAGVLSPRLVADRQYRFHVEKTWKPSGSSTNFADMACETTNGSQWTHTGKGLRIGNVSYGATNSSVNCRPGDHTYDVFLTGRNIEEEMEIVDTGQRSDNLGHLEVRVYQRAVVTYNYLLADVSTPGGTIEHEVPTTTVTPGTIPPVTVPPVSIPGVTLPTLGDIRFFHQNEFWCIELTIGSQRQPIGCIFDPGKPQGSPLPDSTITIGGDTVFPGAAICSPGSQEPFCTLVPGVPLEPITIPGQTVGASIPEGSKLTITFSWTADTTRLWRTQVNDRDESGRESTAVWAPFHTSERDWFIDQARAQNLAVIIKLTVTDPAGTEVASIPTIRVGGLGQILEALFMTKVAESN